MNVHGHGDILDIPKLFYSHTQQNIKYKINSKESEYIMIYNHPKYYE
jgi:hypothetical protein